MINENNNTMKHYEKTFAELAAVIMAFENISQEQAKAKAFKLINDKLNSIGL